jgi:hypothetical protein
VVFQRTHATLLIAQVIVAERGPLVWVFNFSPTRDYEGLKARFPTASYALGA